VDRTQTLGLAIFVAAGLVLLVAAVGSLWAIGIADIFYLLLLLSGITFAFDLLSKKLKLQSTGRILSISIIIGALLLFLVPVVQTIPSNGGSATVCKPSGCSEVFQFKSMTNFLWCYGATYSYSPQLNPPEFGFGLGIGCLPPL
jgi:hypothetical protein